MQRAIPVAAALLAGALGLLDFFRNIELQTYDLRVAATARPSAPSDHIVLIAIDNESLRRMEPLVGRWPWPRLMHATVIDYLAAAGAKVIGYDVLFAERDIRKFMVADTEWTGDESDAALVESTRKAGNVVHIAEASSIELADPSRALKENLDAPALNAARAVDGLHRATAAPDAAIPGARRRVARHRPLAVHARFERRGPPRLAGRAGRRSHDSVVLAGDGDRRRARRRRCDARVDETGHCAAMIPWRGPAREPQRPADVHVVLVLRRLLFAAADHRRAEAGHRSGALQGSHRHRRRDRGGPERGVHDAVPAGRNQRPRSARQHGRRVSVESIDRTRAQLGHGRARHRGGRHCRRRRRVPECLADRRRHARVAAALLAWQSVALFARGTWIPVTVPLLALVFAFVGDLAWKYFVEGREKRQVKRLFSRYVSKDVYEQLIANPSLAALGGERRHMTVLFSDIRGFTTMSEKGTPEDVVAS